MLLYVNFFASISGQIEHIDIYEKNIGVISSNENPPFPIDVVFTWAGETNDSNLRTAYNYELQYSLRSVFSFLPWVNHIYILMNPPVKKPSWFKDDYKKYITLVDHKTTFDDEKYLPCTNSNSIETTIHRIPQLSEHFIYFNDDVFVGKKLPYTYFFTLKGKPILASRVKTTLEQNKTSNLPFIVPPIANGFYPHIPLPLLKSQIIEFQKQYPEFIDWVRSFKIRKTLGCLGCEEANLNCPCMQIQGTIGPFMYKNKKAVVRKQKEQPHCSPSYVKSHCPNTLDTITNPSVLTDILYEQPNTFVIQDTSLDKNRRLLMRKKLKQWFPKMYPDIPPFEKKLN